MVREQKGKGRERKTMRNEEGAASLLTFDFGSAMATDAFVE